MSYEHYVEASFLDSQGRLHKVSVRRDILNQMLHEAKYGKQPTLEQPGQIIGIGKPTSRETGYIGGGFAGYIAGREMGIAEGPARIIPEPLEGFRLAERTVEPSFRHRFSSQSDTELQQTRDNLTVADATMAETDRELAEIRALRARIDARRARAEQRGDKDG